MMYYSLHDATTGLWQNWISDSAVPSVLAPMDRIRAGKTVAIQEFSVKMPDDARFTGYSAIPRGHAFLSAPSALPSGSFAAKQTDCSQVPFWIGVSVVLTAIRLGVAWAEWQHKEEQRRHWQLLESMDRRLMTT